MATDGWKTFAKGWNGWGPLPLCTPSHPSWVIKNIGNCMKPRHLSGICGGSYSVDSSCVAHPCPAPSQHCRQSHCSPAWPNLPQQAHSKHTCIPAHAGPASSHTAQQRVHPFLLTSVRSWLLPRPMPSTTSLSPQQRQRSNNMRKRYFISSVPCLSMSYTSMTSSTLLSLCGEGQKRPHPESSRSLESAVLSD